MVHGKLDIVDNKFVKVRSLDDARQSLKELENKTNTTCQQALLTAESLFNQLQETKYRFFRVIDSISDIVIIKDSENKWKTANKFTQELFKISPNMYIGRTNLEISKLNSNISGLLFKDTTTDNKAWGSKEPLHFVNDFEIYSQSYLFDIVKTPTYDDNNNPYELIVIGRDISNN